MTTAKSGKKTIGIWAIVCILLIVFCFMVLMIPRQEAYAETKRVSGSYKKLPRVARTMIPVADSTQKGWMNANNSVLSSADPDWNNARFFHVSYNESLKESTTKGYGPQRCTRKCSNEVIGP